MSGLRVRQPRRKALLQPLSIPGLEQAVRETLHPEDIIAEYRQMFLRIATAAGEDTSGIDNPDQLIEPDISEYALRAVEQLRRDYDECLGGDS